MVQPSFIERRRHPRFGVAGRLAGNLVDQDLPVRVRDIGLGGFSIETMLPLEPGIEHRMRFVSPDDWSAVLSARIANCRPSCTNDGAPLYVSGCAFSDGERPETKRTIQILIEKVTSVQLYGTDN